MLNSLMYDGEQLFSQVDSQGDFKDYYLYGEGVDELWAKDSANGVEFYLSDRLGTVHDRIDGSGTVVNSVDYSSFGIPLSESGVPEPFKFTSREYDPETGLYYYRARYYDPVLGRFLSQDPLGFDGGDTNLYRYVANAPMNGTDPLGTTMVGYQSSYVPSLALLNSASTASYVKSAEGGLALLAGIIATRVQAEARAREQSFFKLQAVSTQNTIGLGKVISTTYAFAYGMFELFTAGPDTAIVIDSNGTSTVTLEQFLSPALNVFGIKKESDLKCDPENPIPIRYRGQKVNNEHADPNCRSGKTCFYSRNAALPLILLAWYGGKKVPPPPSAPTEQNNRLFCANPNADLGYYNKGTKPKLNCVLIRIRRDCSFRGYPQDMHGNFPPKGTEGGD